MELDENLPFSKSRNEPERENKGLFQSTKHNRKTKSLTKLLCYVKLEKLDDAARKGNFTCPKCDFTFIYRKCFIKHMLQHRNLNVLNDKENRPVRNKCKRKSVRNFKTLNRIPSKNSAPNQQTSYSDAMPMPLHCQEIIFTCNVCKIKIYGEVQFERHYERFHSFSKGIIHCSHCPETLDTKEALFWHLQTYHFHFNTYKCSECDVVTCSKARLTEHVNDAHKMLKSLPCWACDSNFSSEDDLIDHFEDNHFKI